VLGVYVNPVCADDTKVDGVTFPASKNTLYPVALVAVVHSNMMADVLHTSAALVGKTGVVIQAGGVANTHTFTLPLPAPAAA
jgi:hypothetical protein